MYYIIITLRKASGTYAIHNSWFTVPFTSMTFASSTYGKRCLLVERFFNEIENMRIIRIIDGLRLYTIVQTLNYKSRTDTETKKRFTSRTCHSVYVISEFWELEYYSSRCGRIKDANISRQFDNCVFRKIEMCVLEGNHSYTLNVLDFLYLRHLPCVILNVLDLLGYLEGVLYFFIFFGHTFSHDGFPWIYCESGIVNHEFMLVPRDVW